MYETIYEISKHPFPSSTVFMIFLFFLFFIGGGAYLVDYLDNIKQQKKGSFARRIRILGTFIFACVWLLFLLVTVCYGVISIMYGGSHNAEFSKKYYNNEYLTVEGEIADYNKEELIDHKQDESFTVNGVLFSHQHFDVGFCNNKNRINKNGQHVKIWYVHRSDIEGYEEDEEYKKYENVIVKIMLYNDQSERVDAAKDDTEDLFRMGVIAMATIVC